MSAYVCVPDLSNKCTEHSHYSYDSLVNQLMPKCLNIFQDSSVKLLRGETTVLSRAKRKLEQHLQSVKQHLQGLDTFRRSLKSKISSLSRSLELDAQNLKVLLPLIFIAI